MKIVDPNKPDETLQSDPPVRTAQVLRFRGITKLDLDPHAVIDGAREKGLKVVVILGYDEKGGEFFASSVPDGADVLWLLERLKAQLLATDGGERHA